MPANVELSARALQDSPPVTATRRLAIVTGQAAVLAP